MKKVLYLGCLGKEPYLNAMNMDKFWNFRMFTIEKRKLKVIFRLRAMPSSHVCSRGQIEQHWKDGRDQLAVSFRTEPCQQVVPT
jgi:hypothetical protein